LDFDSQCAPLAAANAFRGDRAEKIALKRKRWLWPKN
jgi:hypothetical protein